MSRRKAAQEAWPCSRAIARWASASRNSAGNVPECLPETADRVGLPGARSAEKILGGLAVVLHPLDRGQAVMDFAWCFGHDGHLRSPASAFGLERASGNQVGTHLSRGGNIPLRGPVATSLATVSLSQPASQRSAVKLRSQ